MAEPKIVMKIKFVPPKTGAGLIDYQDRDEAVSTKDQANIQEQRKESRENVLNKNEPKTERKNFYNYMDRSKATRIESQIETLNEGIIDPQEKYIPTFSKYKNNIKFKEKEALKKRLQIADKNGCNMWSIVLSFSDDYLKECNLIDKNGTLNQGKLKTAVRSGMDRFLEKNGFNKTAFYTGDVHLNTEHVHVHIALSETKSSRSKRTVKGKEEAAGYILQKMIRTGKRQFHQALETPQMRRDEINLEKEIDHTRKEGLDYVRGKYDTTYLKNIIQLDNEPQNKVDYDLKEMYLALPSNKKTWRYKSNAKDFRSTKLVLNRLIDDTLNNDPSFDEFKKVITQQREHDQQIYGNKIAGNIYQTKMQRLRSNIGNHYLRQMKEVIPDNELAAKEELFAKEYVEKLRNLQPKDLEMAIEKATKDRQQYGKEIGRDILKIDRQQYKTFQGYLNAERSLKSQKNKISAQYKFNQADSQLKRVDIFLKNKKSELDPNTLNILEKEKSFFEPLKQNYYVQTLNWNDKHKYLRNLSPKDKAVYQNINRQTQELVTKPNKFFKNNRAVKQAQEQLSEQERLIKLENQEVCEIRTGKSYTPHEFKQIREKSIKNLQEKQSYIQVRRELLYVQNHQKGLFKRLKSYEPGTQEYKNIQKKLNTGNKENQKLLKQRITLEKNIYNSQKDNQTKSPFNLDQKQIPTKPQEQYLTQQLQRLQTQSKQQAKRNIQNNGKRFVKQVGKDSQKATRKLSSTTAKLGNVLKKIANSAGRDIADSKKQAADQFAKSVERQEEMEEQQETQTAEMQAQQQEAREEQDERRERKGPAR